MSVETEIIRKKTITSCNYPNPRDIQLRSLETAINNMNTNITYILEQLAILKNQILGVEHTVWYLTVGDEGNELIFNGNDDSTNLLNKTVIAVNKENYELMPTTTFPTPKQFSWSSTTGTLTFSDAVQPEEQIKITYR